MGSLTDRFANQALFRARGMLRLAQGDPEGAAADALACGRIIEAVGMRNPAISPWQTEAALAYLALGDARQRTRARDRRAEPGPPVG